MSLKTFIIGIRQWRAGGDSAMVPSPQREMRMITANAALPADCVHPDEGTVAALQCHAAVAETMLRFATSLQDEVFIQPPECDEKEALMHRNILLRADSYLILQLIWKESPYVTDAELAAVGLAREFKGASLTCYQLGVRLAVSKQEVGKSNSRMRAVITAAEIYALIVRDVGRPKHRPLAGTALLHSVMIGIARPIHFEAINQVIAVSGPEA